MVGMALRAVRRGVVDLGRRGYPVGMLGIGRHGVPSLPSTPGYNDALIRELVTTTRIRYFQFGSSG